MQKFHLFFQNLKQQNVVSILLTAVVSNAVYAMWYQVPFVSQAIYGTPATFDPLNQGVYFGMTVFGLLNMLVSVLGLAMLIPKKGAATGFLVGTVVAIFFSMNAYLSSFIGAPANALPSSTLMAITFAGLMIFYALPGMLLGHFRKE